MLISPIIFVCSGLGIIGIISLKRYQDRHDVLLFWPVFRNRVEVRLSNLFEKVQVESQLGTKIFYIMARRISEWSRFKARELETKLDKKSRNMLSLVKGKRLLGNRGRVSVFLNDIKDFKEETRRK